MSNDPHIILDAHLDIAWNADLFGRDFTESALSKRTREVGSEVETYLGGATVGLPEMLLGRVGIAFGTIYTPPANSKLSRGRGYETPGQAHTLGLTQADIYHKLADSHPNIALIRTQKELQNVLDSWAEGVPLTDHKVGIVILMEGADPIREPSEVDFWYERGVRIIGPAWGATRYSGGTASPGGLTPLGHDLLSVMSRYKAILDLSHMAEEAYLQAVDRYEGQIIASHSNPRRFCESDRHLSDDMVRRLAERDGVMGVVMYNRFMWQLSATPDKADAPMTRIAEIIDHICQVTGSARHVGLGSDWDGGFGMERIPAEMDTIGDLRLLRPLLAGRGYSDADIGAIERGNFLRVLRAALPY
ncbi:MAG TPA: membrane dipeptidase [Aggregatilineales bacterium]|nr:membrane dipeptidase [Anaerolineales bacterium]HRE47975.1 membrane dipeptidase [Aggregatilineales bacterium]